MLKSHRRFRGFKVTIYLAEEFKGDEFSYRMWNALMALDVSVVEEHKQAGVLIGEWEYEDAPLLEKVPGVAAARVRKREEEDKTAKAPIPLKRAPGPGLVPLRIDHRRAS